MSIRMALAKLSAVAATGAIVGGGATHIAEPSAKNKGYVKQLKQVKAKPVKRTVQRAQPRTVKRMRKIVKTETNRVCAPTEALMAVPLPPPVIPQPPVLAGGGGAPVVIGGGPVGFGGGGFFGGFFGGGGGGGSVVVSSTSTGSTST